MNSEDENPRERGRQLRAQSTDAERKLWTHLCAKRFAGFKFRRQHRIGPYFADFCCTSRRLVVELDGGQHSEQEAERMDAARTAYLEGKGYRVLRFWNDQVSTELDGVLQVIQAALIDS